ncbi:MAG: hypothetical protein JWR21_3683 [Herminiimonas sp.]|nr:hypothetical protein [Herminiimonas sp.]
MVDVANAFSTHGHGAAMVAQFPTTEVHSDPLRP